MQPFNPMQNEAEEIDPATGLPYVPNVPRDPDDPREKMKTWMKARLDAQQQQASPEFRQASQAPMQELDQSNRDLALGKLFMGAANQAGTVGGKAASSKPFDDYTATLQNQNQMAGQRIMQDRQSAMGQDDQRMKLMQYLADKQQQGDDRTYQHDRDEKDYQLKRDALDIQRQMANAKADKVTGASEGLKALDKDYAKDYNDWTSTGKAGYDKNIGLLEQAKQELMASKGNFGTSGNIVGRLPDFARSENSRVIQQKVQTAAQGAMKAALGSAFTEKEGERIMKLSYDPTLSPEQNLAKIDEAIADLKAKASNQEGKARHFEKSQTLKDYAAPQETPAGTGGGNSNPPQAGQEMDGYIFLGGDPADQKSWRKK